MRVHNCDLVDDKHGIFSVLGLVDIHLGGKYWWAAPNIDTSIAKGVTFGASKDDPASGVSRDVASITVADVSSDPDEPDTASSTPSDVSRIDAMINEAVKAQMDAEGGSLLTWEPTRARELANQRCMITSYIVEVRQKRQQIVAVRLGAGTKKLVVACAYDTEDAEAEQIVLCTEFWLLGRDRPAVSLFDLALGLGKRRYDGSSAERAIVVDNVAAEYAILQRHYAGYKQERQALRQVDGRPYDVLTLSNGSGNTTDLYFDISMYYGR